MTEFGPNPVRDAALGPEWLRVGEVALTVRHPERMEAFYRDVIGLEVLDRTGGTVRLGTGNAKFLDLVHQPDALPDNQAAAGLFHTAFLLPFQADLGRWLAHAGTHGQRLDGAADHLVSEAIYLSDPEGNGVEVYADRPRAQWNWSGKGRDRHVEMANRPLDAEGLLREGATAPWTGAPNGTRVGHVHLRVGEVAEARRFYGDVLGMDVTASWPGAVFLSTGGYHHQVAANMWQSSGAGMRDPQRAGLASVTFEVADQAALAGIAQRAGVVELVGHELHDPWGTTLRFLAASHSDPVPRSHGSSTSLPATRSG